MPADSAIAPDHPASRPGPRPSGRARVWPSLVAIVACLLLAATISPFVPGAGAAAGKATSCGAKTIAITHGGSTVKVPVSRITVEGGATCAEAPAVIRGFVLHKIPTGWKVRAAKVDAPQGLKGETAENGRKRIGFALVGN